MPHDVVKVVKLLISLACDKIAYACFPRKVTWNSTPHDGVEGAKLTISLACDKIANACFPQ